MIRLYDITGTYDDGWGGGGWQGRGIMGGMDGGKSCSEAISAMLLEVIYDLAHRIFEKSVLTD